MSILTGGHHHHGPSNKKCADTDASDHDHSHSNGAHIGAAPVCPCHADDPGADLDALQHMAHEIQEYEEEHSHSQWEGLPEHHHEDSNNLHLAEEGTNTETDSDVDSVDDAVNRRKLMITSINTALAIGLYVGWRRSRAFHLRTSNLTLTFSCFTVTTFPKVWQPLWPHSQIRQSVQSWPWPLQS